MHLTVPAKAARLLGLVMCLVFLPILTSQAAGQAPAAPDNLAGSIASGVASLTWDVPADDGYNI